MYIVRNCKFYKLTRYVVRFFVVVFPSICPFMFLILNFLYSSCPNVSYCVFAGRQVVCHYMIKLIHAHVAEVPFFYLCFKSFI